MEVEAFKTLQRNKHMDIIKILEIDREELRQINQRTKKLMITIKERESGLFRTEVCVDATIQRFEEFAKESKDTWITAVVYSYADVCRNITTQWRRATQFFRKIYLSLYLKGLCMRGSWRPNRTATYWPPLLTAFLSLSPELLDWGPVGPASVGQGSHSSIFSPTDLNSNCSIGGPEAPLCWVLVLSTAAPTNSNFLCTE